MKNTTIYIHESRSCTLYFIISAVLFYGRHPLCVVSLQFACHLVLILSETEIVIPYPKREMEA